MLKPSPGFSLVELMITLAIFSVLISLAIPNYAEWIRNTKVRTAAEAIQNGLQLAKTEAVRRNTTVRFQLTDTLDSSCAPSTTGPHWVVSLDDATGKCDTPPSDTVSPRIFGVRNGREGGASTTTLATVAGNTVVFNGMGRITPASEFTVNISDTFSSGPVRSLRIVVSAGGQIRMCDPALPSTDIQSCG